MPYDREAPLKCQVQKALTQMGYQWYRINSGRVRVKGGWMHGAPAGTPDIQVLAYNREIGMVLVWVETKSQTGELRKAQEEFHDNLRPQVFLECRCLDDLLGFLTHRKLSPR